METNTKKSTTSIWEMFSAVRGIDKEAAVVTKLPNTGMQMSDLKIRRNWLDCTYCAAASISVNTIGSIARPTSEKTPLEKYSYR